MKEPKPKFQAEIVTETTATEDHVAQVTVLKGVATLRISHGSHLTEIRMNKQGLKRLKSTLSIALDNFIPM